MIRDQSPKARAEADLEAFREIAEADLEAVREIADKAAELEADACLKETAVMELLTAGVLRDEIRLAALSALEAADAAMASAVAAERHMMDYAKDIARWEEAAGEPLDARKNVDAHLAEAGRMVRETHHAALRGREMVGYLDRMRQIQRVRVDGHH